MEGKGLEERRGGHAAGGEVVREETSAEPGGLEVYHVGRCKGWKPLPKSGNQTLRRKISCRNLPKFLTLSNILHCHFLRIGLVTPFHEIYQPHEKALEVS